MKKNPFNTLQNRILAPLVLVFVILFCVFAYSLNQLHKNSLQQQLSAETRTIKEFSQSHIKADSKQLRLALSVITLNKEILAALRSKDREHLYSSSKPLKERLRSEFDITHLYFVAPDRTTILRAYNPERYGDKINRVTMLQAQKTGQVALGWELGPLGTFTLRAVMPWHDNKKLIGFVEVGMEIQHLLRELDNVVNKKTLTFINKDALSREGWEAGMKLMLNPDAKWDDFPNTVLVEKQKKEIPEQLIKLMAEEQPQQDEMDIQFAGAHYRIVYIPLLDIEKRTVGHISVLHDISSKMTALNSSLLITSILSALVCTGLCLLFQKLLGAIELELSTVHSRLLDEKEALKKSEETVLRLNEGLEQKVAERTVELVETLAKLAEEEKMATLGRLAGNVGNDIRNPLGVMRNAIYFLQGHLSDIDETTREYLDIIDNEIAYAKQIAEDLSDYTATNVPHKSKVSAKKLLHQALEQFKIPENIKLDTKIEEKLPELDVDPQQIQQAMRHLISNALQAMPDGGELRIAVRHAPELGTGDQKQGTIHELPLQHDTRFIEISISDSGKGIAAENIDKIFQPLFTTKARGIGLGLNISKNLVEANSGTIKVESVSGIGATFTITLPGNAEE